ncbi:MAG: hypothetical protein HY717_03775 [Planctomycetes bacterium]|nr:hypothetical protein [Planctomycetota bacterium]
MPSNRLLRSIVRGSPIVPVFLALLFHPLAKAQEPLALKIDPAEKVDKAGAGSAELPRANATDAHHVVAPRTAAPRPSLEMAGNRPEKLQFVNPWTGLLRFDPPQDPDAEAGPLGKTGPLARSGVEDPTDYRQEYQRIPGKADGRESPFDLEIEFESRPDYLPSLKNQPIFDSKPRARKARHQAVWNLLEKEAYRQLRRFLKREWRHQFEANPSMTNEFYESRLAQINNIGKEADEIDLYNTDYYSNQFRNAALDMAELEGERELNLVEWGPLRINDHGSINFDLKAWYDPEPNQDQGLKFASSNGTKDAALFKGRHYHLHTSFRLNYDPLRAWQKSDLLEGVRSYGGALEIDFLSDILKKQLFTTEVEASVRSDGEMVFFVNWVFKGRK